MTKEQEFYNRVEDEFDDFVHEIEEYDVSDILCESERIAKIKSIYDYLTEHRPVNEENYSLFMNVEKPIEAICNKYDYDKEEYHRELNGVIETLTQECQMNKNSAFGELRWKVHELWEEFQNLIVVYVDEKDIEKIATGIMNPSFRLSEYDSKILLQFRNPLLVLASEMGKLDEPIERCVERAIETLNRVDLLTYKYNLEKDKILPETKHRHNAINELINLIPDFYFSTATEWLNLNMRINKEMLLDGSDGDPYREFLDTMHEIKKEHGDKILQKVFDMGEDIVIYSSALTEVAKYLADGGDVDRVSDLYEEKFFEIPYEEQKQGGMDLC